MRPCMMYQIRRKLWWVWHRLGTLRETQPDPLPWVAPLPTARFDRFDVCEAYWTWAQDTDDVIKAQDALDRLAALGFKPGLSVRQYRYDGLSDNGRAIYDTLREREHG